MQYQYERHGPFTFGYATSSASAGFTSVASTGSSTTGALYSFGSSGSPDRALGSIGSGTVGNFYWGLALTNTSGHTLNSFSLGYTGEQWRNSATSGQAMTVEFGLGATGLRAGTFIPLDQLTFVSPVTGGTAGAINGNAAGSRQVFTGQSVDNLQWLAGQTLWLRWLDPDHAGYDHGLAIDDVRFSAQSFEAPAGYYAAAANLTGQGLFDALHGIIRNQTVIPLDSGSTDTVTALSFLDADPADTSKVRLIYGGNDSPATSYGVANTGWVREFLWPANKGIGSTGADASDLFNLRPISAAVLAARNGRFYDVSDWAASSYLTPAHSAAGATSSLDGDSWEPPKDQRGDIARALFYMDVRYDGNLANDSNTTDLVLENSLGNPSDMAVLRTLLVWHEVDPVDDVERLRNDRIYRLYQHNRNPFVDHPEYAEAIYATGPNAAAAPMDADLDGMEDAWERVFHFDPANAADAVLDPDNDGFGNAEEYWMGSDPRDALSPVTLIVDGSYTGTLELGTTASPYKTIQSAIDAAPVNERRAILVAPGSYDERPNISDHQELHLFSMQGATKTAIEGANVNSSVVRLVNFRRASFVGFTVRNAYTDWRGAGLRAISTNGNILISENVFQNNVSTYSSDNNGGGGAIYLEVANGSRVTSNMIIDNAAQRGGGVLFAAGNVQFYHNTVAGNKATNAAMGGGLSALNGVQPDIRNNILWSNTASGSLNQIHGLTLTGNLLQGGGANNIATDPQFISADLADYHIRSTSPARSAATTLPVGRDVDGEVRPASNRDLGADQYVDTDGDGLPDAWELQYDLNPNDPSDATSTTATDSHIPPLTSFNSGGNPHLPTANTEFRAVPGIGYIDLYWDASPPNNQYRYIYQIRRWMGSPSTSTQRATATATGHTLHDPQPARTEGKSQLPAEPPLVGGQTYYYQMRTIRQRIGALGQPAPSYISAGSWSAVISASPYISTGDDDHDGINNRDEILIYHTDPTNPDSDDDGLNDGLEVLTWHTNPLYFDSDNDLFPDGWEVINHFDPLVADNHDGDKDGDGLSNFDELIYCTRADLTDTDNDGFSDGAEVNAGSIPVDSNDTPNTL